MTPKAVARKVMNTFGHPEHIIKQITSLIDNDDTDLFEVVERKKELKAFEEEYKTEFDVMRRLQNVISHVSKHAGGVLIYPNLADTVPLTWDRGEEMYVAEFDKYMVEEKGHFKFDVLGLETLPILYNTVRSIRESGIDIDLKTIDMEDKAVYDMIASGDVSGLFQINNQAQKVMEQKPQNFRDLIAINALIRPGVGDWHEYIARRKGKPYEIYEPRRPYMEETVGTMTYQEQFLLDCHVLAGWGIAFADKRVRKNKNIRDDTAIREKFIEDCTANGHPIEEVEAVWEEIEHAVDGGYSFNKSHSASYAVMTYQSAYLKYHYPTHFYAALMNGKKTDSDGQKEIASIMAECKARGIKILPPDINVSTDKFTPTPNGIAYKINTIKNVGEKAVAEIISMRPIHSFEDFLERRNKTLIMKNIVVNLIKAGTFDSLDANRGELMWQFDMWNRTKTQVKQDYICGLYEVDNKKYAEWEHEVLNMYLTSHPLEQYGFHPLDHFKDGERALQGGEVMDLYEFHPKKDPSKPKMAFITLNTLYGVVKVVCFARQWTDETKAICVKGNLLMVSGKRSGKDILLDKVEVLK